MVSALKYHHFYCRPIVHFYFSVGLLLYFVLLLHFWQFLSIAEIGMGIGIILFF